MGAPPKDERMPMHSWSHIYISSVHGSTSVNYATLSSSAGEVDPPALQFLLNHEAKDTTAEQKMGTPIRTKHFEKLK